MYATTWADLTGETLDAWTARRNVDQAQFIAQLGEYLPLEFYLFDIGGVPGVNDGVLRSVRDMPRDYNLDHWIERAANETKR